MVNVPTQQISQVKNQTNKAAGKMADIIGFEFLIVVVVGIVGTLVLNYFSVFPLSEKFPKIFGFLPHKTVTSTGFSNIFTGNTQDKNTTIGSESAEFVPQYLFSCPIPSACPEMKPLYDRSDGQFKGSGILKADQKIPVQAVIDGKIISSEEKDGIVTLVEESKDQSFEVTYKFVGTRAAVAKVDKGELKNYEVIGMIKGEAQPLTSYTSQKYYFYLSIIDLRTKSFIPVKAAKNANGLEFL